MTKKKETTIQRRMKKSEILSEYFDKTVNERWEIYRVLAFHYLKNPLLLFDDDRHIIRKICEIIHKNYNGDPRTWTAAVYYWYWTDVIHYFQTKRRKIIADFFGINADHMAQKSNKVRIIIDDHKDIKLMVHERQKVKVGMKLTEILRLQKLEALGNIEW